MTFSNVIKDLPGVRPQENLAALVEQIISSLRRIEYVHVIRDRYHDPRRMDPRSDLFDPLKAAILHNRAGHFDEAFWLVFLAIHFGKHAKDGWRLVRDVYGRFGDNGVWDWNTVSSDPCAFRTWLEANANRLTTDGIFRRFGNHRKYESLVPPSGEGTADAVASYVTWIGPPRTHQQMIRDAHMVVGQHPEATFDYLYRSMSAVKRFGRLARFDYLTMLGKLGLAPIVPGSAYLGAATGPLSGARLLFGGHRNVKLSARILDGYLRELDNELSVGMQVLEDSLCNWQKSPSKFVYFRG